MTNTKLTIKLTAKLISIFKYTPNTNWSARGLFENFPEFRALSNSSDECIELIEYMLKELHKQSLLTRRNDNRTSEYKIL